LTDFYTIFVLLGLSVLGYINQLWLTNTFTWKEVLLFIGNKLKPVCI